MNATKGLSVADNRGVLPMIISETGADDEPEIERIICVAISGGADYLNDMPRELTLERITPQESIFARYIQTDQGTRWGRQPAPPAEGGVVVPSDEDLLRLMPERWTAPVHAAAAIQADALSYARVVWAAAAAAHQIQPAPPAEGAGQVDPIRAALERLVEAAERVARTDPIGAWWWLSDAIDAAHATLAAAPEGEGPSESDVANLFYRHMGEGSEVGFENAIAEALARWGCQPAPLAEGESPAESLAARPLLEKVARIGHQTVAQVQQVAKQAAAWLQENPPGQPVAIEPRGCPMPGACSCVEPTALPLPQGEVK